MHGLLTDINTSLTTSTFPYYWKEAVVIPLLKERDNEQASNIANSLETH